LNCDYSEAFYPTLPWSTCNSSWASSNCADSNGYNGNVSVTQEYFDNYVLSKSSGISDFGVMQPKLLLPLVLTWIMIYFFVFKGTKIIGKVRGLDISCLYHIPLWQNYIFWFAKTNITNIFSVIRPVSYGKPILQPITSYINTANIAMTCHHMSIASHGPITFSLNLRRISFKNIWFVVF